MNPIGCSSKPESTRMMGIRSNKVPCLLFRRYRTRKWITDAPDCDSIRNINRMDGTQWDGYGTEFSGGRGLHGYLVKTLANALRGRIAVLLTSMSRDFVNSVQQHMSLTTAGRIQTGPDVRRVTDFEFHLQMMPYPKTLRATIRSCYLRPSLGIYRRSNTL